MLTKKTVLSTFYLSSTTVISLLLQPYQVMQLLVREKVFIWLVLTPSALLAFVTMVWRFLLIPFFQLFISCAEISWGCGWLLFVANVITFFCLYWQVMLLYLLVRFHYAFAIKKTV